LPALIIHGDSDKTVPLEATSAEAAKMIDAALFKVYEGAPHGLFYTHRDELNMDIAAFIQTGKTTVVEKYDLLPSNEEALITR